MEDVGRNGWAAHAQRGASGGGARLRTSSPRFVTRVLYSAGAPSSSTDATVAPRGSVWPMK
jgi:hypothetical protein